MSLIDSSYFVGPLTIAQIGQPAVNNNLNLFISRLEVKFLREALGYQLYLDFIDGLSQPIIEQRWLDLRDGVDFETVSNWPNWWAGFSWFNKFYWLNSKRLVHWPGFASPSTVMQNNPNGQLLVLKAGSGAGNPVVGQNSFTLARLAGATYTIERRDFGTMIQGLDYQLSNNNQTITLLAPGDIFAVNEVFIIRFSIITQSGTPNPTYQSPLAGYVYYHWQRDQISMSTGSGVVKSDTENARSVSPVWKMTDAWNQMSEDVFLLWQLLEARGTSVYPSYDLTKIMYGSFRPINTMNI